jgi:hypothetical protein
LELFLEAKDNGRFAFFAANTFLASGGVPQRIYVGDSDEFSVDVYDLNGKLTRIVRDQIPPSKITSHDVELERNELLEWGRTIGRLEAYQRLADAMPLPSRKPAFDRLLVDSEGYLWVKEYGSLSPAPVRYRIYAPTGERVARAAVSGRVRLYDIGFDYLLGVNYDADGAETIVMYDLTRR